MNIHHTPASSTTHTRPFSYFYVEKNTFLEAVDNTGIRYRLTRGGGSVRDHQTPHQRCLLQGVLFCTVSWSHSTFNQIKTVSPLPESDGCVQIWTCTQFTFVRFVVVGTFYHWEQQEVLIMGPQEQISKNTSYLWPFLATWQINYESFPSDSTHRSEKKETQSEILACSFLHYRNKNRAFKINTIIYQNL